MIASNPQMVFIRLFICLMISFAAFPAFAAADSESLRFALGYSFLSNVDELKDSYKDRSKYAGYGNDIYNTSINLSFQPYYQFENNLRAGAGVGPLILLLGDAHHIEVPLNLTLGYTFLPDSRYCPYFRTGISCHLASGDFYSDSSPGFFGGIGLGMFNSRSVHLGFEVAYDAAELSLKRSPAKPEHEKIKTGEWTFYLYADF